MSTSIPVRPVSAIRCLVEPPLGTYNPSPSPPDHGNQSRWTSLSNYLPQRTTTQSSCASIVSQKWLTLFLVLLMLPQNRRPNCTVGMFGSTTASLSTLSPIVDPNSSPTSLGSSSSGLISMAIGPQRTILGQTGKRNV